MINFEGSLQLRRTATMQTIETNLMIRMKVLYAVRRRMAQCRTPRRATRSNSSPMPMLSKDQSSITLKHLQSLYQIRPKQRTLPKIFHQILHIAQMSP